MELKEVHAGRGSRWHGSSRTKLAFVQMCNPLSLSFAQTAPPSWGADTSPLTYDLRPQRNGVPPLSPAGGTDLDVSRAVAEELRPPLPLLFVVRAWVV